MEKLILEKANSKFLANTLFILAIPCLYPFGHMFYRFSLNEPLYMDDFNKLYMFFCTYVGITLIYFSYIFRIEAELLEAEIEGYFE